MLKDNFNNINSTNKTSLQAEKFKRLSLDECVNLKEGEMKQVKFGTTDDESVLVLRYKNQLRALSNKCPHYGAPLHTGILIDNLLKCPWHGSSFNILTGETDIAPSIDNLTTYEILSDSNGIYINLPENVQQKVKPKMFKRDKNDKRKFVIIGGGPCGLSAAEVLREIGYTGEITILSKDQYIPYDRPVMSKNLPDVVEKIFLRSPEFLKEYDIDIHNNVNVFSIDNINKKVKLEDGKEFSYDKLLLASGASPILPDIPGVENQNAFVLRSFNDLKKIKSAAQNAKNILIVGGGFIGMETASSLKKAYPSANVTVVVHGKTPFLKILGPEVGHALQKLHEKNNVIFKLDAKVTEITKEGVVLSDGTSLPADLVLLGVGIKPNTDFLSNSLDLDKKKYVKTDKYLKTSDDNIFAAGDIATVPYFKTGDLITSGHFIGAQQQGAFAAMNMFGMKTQYDYVPFFWSMMWEEHIQYTGYGTTFDEVFVDGDLDKLKFIAYYIKDDKIVAFSAMNTPNAVNIMYEAFRNDKVPTATSIKNGSSNLDSIKKFINGVKPRCSRSDCVCAKRKAAEENAIKN